MLSKVVGTKLSFFLYFALADSHSADSVLEGPLCQQVGQRWLLVQHIHAASAAGFPVAQRAAVQEFHQYASLAT